MDIHHTREKGLDFYEELTIAEYNYEGEKERRKSHEQGTEPKTVRHGCDGRKTTTKSTIYQVSTNGYN